jgi:DNA-binding NtrC family response regulator
VVLPLQASHILLVDPDVHVRKTVAGFLRRAGHRVTERSSLPEGSRRGSLQDYDAVVLGLAWPEREQPKRLRSVKRLAGQAPVLVLCAPDRVELGVGALSHGADDYLLRPPHENELKVRLERLLDRREMDSRIAFFQNELSKRSGVKSFEARSPTMRAVLERVLRVAPMRSTVLIYGESGVGKELVARSIHFNSPRRERPFIALNCAAMPANLIESELFGHEKGSFTGAHTRSRGKFEMAHQGSLFLDEIGELDPVTQAKLLRVLEEREFMRVGGSQSIRVDVRVIAATNADLESMVLDASFRRDLYYRLKVVTITVPPLRERRPDIPALVNTFLDELSRANAVNRKTLTPQAMTALQDYHWPGNVRELKNLLESALVSVTGDVIRLEDLPRAVRQERAPRGSAELTPGTTLAELERVLILRTLEHTGGNRTHSAALLGIGVRTLQRKIQSYGIDIPSKRRRPHRRSKVTRLSS